MDDTATYLMLISDKAVGLVNTCSLTVEDALELLQSLHALRDEELKKNAKFVNEKLLETCSEDCHCGLYADVAEDEVLKNKFYLRAKSLSKEKQLYCAARTSKWICQDSLLKELKSQKF